MSLRTKFLLLAALIQALLVSLLIWNNLRLLDTAITKNAYRMANEYAVTLNFSLTPYSSTGRLPELQSYVKEMLSDPHDNLTRYLMVVDTNYQPLIKVGTVPDNATLNHFYSGNQSAKAGLQMQLQDSVIHVSAPILLTKNNVGKVYFGLSTEDLTAARLNVLKQGIVIGIVSFLLALMLFYLFTQKIGRRLRALTEQAQKMVAGELGTVMTEKDNDEIQVYADSLNTMSISLHQRVQQLEMSEQRLAQSEARFKILFDMAPVALAVSKLDGTLLDVNMATTTLFNAEFNIEFDTEFHVDFNSRIPAKSMNLQDNIWYSKKEAQRVWEIYRQQGSLRGDIATVKLRNGNVLELSVWSASFLVGDQQTIIWALLDHTEERKAKRELTTLNSMLEDRVKERSQALEFANRDLTAALETLQQTQRELINAEKLASLGSLVAGIAHELNTPIGNSLLTATTLSEKSLALENIFMQGKLTRSAMAHHLHETRQGCKLLAEALTKAADLIAAFKQIAVNQNHEQRRIVSLNHMVTSIVDAFGPSFEKAQCQVQIQIPEQLELDTYPSSLRQIFENLINNALIHAFVEHTRAKISISAVQLATDKIDIIFSDNGAGMTADVLDHLFDPFFTTRMGQGGAGLGMSIVYNIVTGILGGSVSADSETHRGTTITLRIPMIAPIHNRSL
ncbi:ATP-binding protein [Undibacterium sp. SXout7W]|uniref:ATP-binding protein n=1 Tax=Undibacterium sp. SXout7W TaxID=3413049 RepID=UPI003BEFA2AF